MALGKGQVNLEGQGDDDLYQDEYDSIKILLKTNGLVLVLG